MTYKQDISRTLKFKLFKIFIILEYNLNKLLSYIKTTPKYVANNFWNILLFILFIVPIYGTIIWDWNLPSIYYLYMLIMICKYIIDFIKIIDDSQYDNLDDIKNEYPHLFNNSSNNKKYIKPLTILEFQKQKNGGLTDEEVKKRKEEIWKKLS